VSIVVAVVGPTATGKSDLGLALARELGGEWSTPTRCSCTGMDVGTAKLSVAARGAVPHHCSTSWTRVRTPRSRGTGTGAVRPGELAASGVGGGRGGSGLYVRACWIGWSFPHRPGRASRAGERAEREGPGVLHDELAGSTRRPPRRSTGATPAGSCGARGARLTGRRQPGPCAVPLRDPRGADRPRLDRAVLDRAIEDRVERMWADGLVEEVRALSAHGLSRTAARAVGYTRSSRWPGASWTRRPTSATVAGTRRLARKQMGCSAATRGCTGSTRRPRLLDRALRSSASGPGALVERVEATARSLGS